MLRCAAVQPPAPLENADAQALRLMRCVCCAGLNRATRAMARTSAVINACSPLAIAPIEVPRYRAVNEEVVKLDLDFGDAFSGALVDREDRLRALWASYSEQVRSARARRATLPPPATTSPPEIGLVGAKGFGAVKLAPRRNPTSHSGRIKVPCVSGMACEQRR